MQYLENKLSLAWKCRNNGDNKFSFELYQAIALELRVDLFSSEEEKLKALRDRGVSDCFCIDFMLLEVAYFRGKLEIEKSKELIARLTKIFNQHRVKTTTTFYMQEGLNFLAQGDFSLALEKFCEGKNLEKNSVDKSDGYYFCFINIIICMEALGHDCRFILRQFIDEYWSLEKKRDVFSSIKEQVAALRLRMSFREGNLGGIAKQVAEEDFYGGQAGYYIVWLASIPWFDLPEGLDKHKEKLLEQQLAGKNHWLFNYRMRSLEGVLIKKDFGDQIKLCAKTSRFYLWVTRWLLGASPSLLSKIIILLEDIRKSSAKGQKMSYLSYMQLENGLRWLAFFGKYGKQDVSLQLKSVDYIYEEEKLTLLGYESMFLDMLDALASGEKEVANDTVDFLNKEQVNEGRFKLVGLKSAIISNDPKMIPREFSRLYVSIRELVDANDHSDEDGRVIIDLFKNQLKVKKNGKVVRQTVSAAITRLLALFNKKDQRSKEEVLSFCFGLENYDEFLHDPKVANLLLRANKEIEGFGTFKSKGASVSLFLTKKDPFKVIGGNQHSILVKEMLSFNMLKQNANNAVKFEESRWYQRQEVQEILEVSKATAIRKLKEWQKSDQVEQKGVNRNLVYRFRKELIETINNEVRQ